MGKNDAQKKINKQSKEKKVELPNELEKKEKDKPFKGEEVKMLSDNEMMIGTRKYRLVYNYRDAFDLEKLGERYSEVLTRYDYIVGDWGYQQLRLKGFFNDEQKKVVKELKISTLEDYLYEFCNFGCAYFVIQKISTKKETSKHSDKQKSKTKPAVAHIEEKSYPINQQQRKFKKATRKQKEKQVHTNSVSSLNGEEGNKTPQEKRNFKIRQKESEDEV